MSKVALIVEMRLTLAGSVRAGEMKVPGDEPDDVRSEAARLLKEELRYGK